MDFELRSLPHPKCISLAYVSLFFIGFNVPVFLFQPPYVAPGSIRFFSWVDQLLP